jgi:hypothetical protein
MAGDGDSAAAQRGFAEPRRRRPRGATGSWRSSCRSRDASRGSDVRRGSRHRERIDARIPGDHRRFIEVPCVTRDQAPTIAKLHRIDYLSMDEEGAEYVIRAVFPFEKWDVFHVEFNRWRRCRAGCIASVRFCFQDIR